MVKGGSLGARTQWILPSKLPRRMGMFYLLISRIAPFVPQDPLGVASCRTPVPYGVSPVDVTLS